ncbi:MAG: transcription elongation factor GreA [Chloroflexota bacterium]
MSPEASAAELLRSVGLDIDGPARWGTKPPSRASGIFAIEAASATRFAPFDIVELRRWLERVPELLLDGERPSDSGLADRLRSFWVPGQTLLYVGRTAKSLAPRVAALYATELGYRRPHSGGHWLKTLRDQHKLRLWWAETDAPEEYEDAVLAAFAEAVPADVRAKLPQQAGPLLPWANLGSPSGGLRDTGLTDSLLNADAEPARSSNIKRSDTAGSSRKRAPARGSTAPKSPRRPKTKVASGPAKRDEPTPVTAEGLENMKAELKRLTTVERPEVVERVKNARELGDLRENADYEAARNEQSFLEGRILELEQRLRTAVIIETSAGSVITLGSTVGYEVDGTPGRMSIVGSTESDPSAGRISAVSPVGKALLGHRAGDEVVVRTPGAEIRYHIIEIK